MPPNQPIGEKEPFYFKSFNNVIGIAHNVTELEAELARLINVDKEAVKYHLREGHIVQWLRYIGEGELAERLTNVTEPEQALQVVRDYLSGKGRNEMRGGRRGQGPRRHHRHAKPY